MKIKTEKEINEIIELSKTLRQKEIGLLYGLSQSRISEILRDNNISNNRTRLNLSKLKFNINYFDEIDIPEKAYWLGFIAADGCLKNNKVRIVSNDEEVIDKFKNCIKSDHKKTISNILDKRTNKVYVGYHIQVTSNLFVQKLSKWIPIDKSEKFSLPKIDENLMAPFLAGLIDGDGCIWFDKGRLRFNIISTKECLLEIQAFLMNKFDIKSTKLQNKINNVWVLIINSNTKEILNYIYNQEFKNLYLTRKYNKWN